MYGYIGVYYCVKMFLWEKQKEKTHSNVGNSKFGNPNIGKGAWIVTPKC